MTIVRRLTTHSLEMICSLTLKISIGCVASSRTPPHCAKIAEKLFFAAALRNGDARSRLSGGAGVLPFTSLSAISVLCVVYIYQAHTYNRRVCSGAMPLIYVPAANHANYVFCTVSAAAAAAAAVMVPPPVTFCTVTIYHLAFILSKLLSRNIRYYKNNNQKTFACFASCKRQSIKTF